VRAASSERRWDLSARAGTVAIAPVASDIVTACLLATMPVAHLWHKSFLPIPHDVSANPDETDDPDAREPIFHGRIWLRALWISRSVVVESTRAHWEASQMGTLEVGSVRWVRAGHERVAHVWHKSRRGPRRATRTRVSWQMGLHRGYNPHPGEPAQRILLRTVPRETRRSGCPVSLAGLAARGWRHARGDSRANMATRTGLGRIPLRR
jgi:hypothetical protein